MRLCPAGFLRSACPGVSVPWAQSPGRIRLLLVVWARGARGPVPAPVSCLVLVLVSPWCWFWLRSGYMKKAEGDLPPPVGVPGFHIFIR